MSHLAPKRRRRGSSVALLCILENTSEVMVCKALSWWIADKYTRRSQVVARAIEWAWASVEDDPNPESETP